MYKCQNVCIKNKTIIYLKVKNNTANKKFIQLIKAVSRKIDDTTSKTDDIIFRGDFRQRI